MDNLKTRIKTALAELEKAEAGLEHAKGSTIVPLFHLGEPLTELWRDNKKGWLEKAKEWGVKKDNAYRAIDFRGFFQTEDKAQAFTGGFRELAKTIRNDRKKNPHNYPWAVKRLIKKNVAAKLPARIDDLRNLAGQVANSILDGTADNHTKEGWDGVVAFINDADGTMRDDRNENGGTSANEEAEKRKNRADDFVACFGGDVGAAIAYLQEHYRGAEPDEDRGTANGNGKPRPVPRSSGETAVSEANTKKNVESTATTEKEPVVVNAGIPVVSADPQMPPAANENGGVGLNAPTQNELPAGMADPKLGTEDRDSAEHDGNGHVVIHCAPGGGAVPSERNTACKAETRIAEQPAESTATTEKPVVAEVPQVDPFAEEDGRDIACPEPKTSNKSETTQPVEDPDPVEMVTDVLHRDGGQKHGGRNAKSHPSNLGRRGAHGLVEIPQWGQTDHENYTQINTGVKQSRVGDDMVGDQTSSEN